MLGAQETCSNESRSKQYPLVTTQTRDLPDGDFQQAVFTKTHTKLGNTELGKTELHKTELGNVEPYNAEDRQLAHIASDYPHKHQRGELDTSAMVVVKAEASVSKQTQEAARRLTALLESHFRRPVRLIVTDNRRTMLSGKQRGVFLELRLHHMFLTAPQPVIAALHRYLAYRDKAAGREVDAFIATHRDKIRSRRRRIQIRTRGKHHNLSDYFELLEATHFPGLLSGVRITWGRRSTTKRQRSIRLGTYSIGDQLIRIHPVLDSDWVPRFYVLDVIHHEILHHLIKPVTSGSRTIFHTPEFRRRERSFEHHQRAAAWEKANLSRLLKEASR